MRRLLGAAQYSYMDQVAHSPAAQVAHQSANVFLASTVTCTYTRSILSYSTSPRMLAHFWPFRFAHCKRNIMT